MLAPIVLAGVLLLALWMSHKGFGGILEDREARLHAEEAERIRAIIREELAKLDIPTTKD